MFKELGQMNKKYYILKEAHDLYLKSWINSANLQRPFDEYHPCHDELSFVN